MIRAMTPQTPLLLLLSLGLVACPGGVDAQQCPSLVWADEFDGAALDETKWSFQTGDGCAEGICGWGNNEEQTYQMENVTVSGGVLQITAKEQRVRNKLYTSGRIRTLGKGEWFSGRFEARVKMTTGQGIWPAFWMLPTDEVFGGWPASGEIDIMENIGSQPATVNGTIHYGDSPQSHQQSGRKFDLHQGAFAEGFHEFVLEKEAGILRWLVDDVLYFSRTPGDIAPANWPFDERFHFLFNVAVGGNFPGSPDSTTVFPQTLEVDYVRVYDGSFPHIAGPRVVPNQATGVVYGIGNALAGSTFVWSVPPGATIVSGQGTSSVTVDWGASGGDVVADVSSSCGNQQLVIGVEVEPPFLFDFVFENFDDPPNVTFDLSTGTLVEVANPDPSGANTSDTSGAYTRNPAEQFDVLFYDVTVINDASQYATNQKKFKIDVLTAAPIGSEILLQLEDSGSATSTNFPTGRHSRYQAFTTVRDQWERLTFTFLDPPDPSTPDAGIDDIVLLFAPNSFTGDVYYFDNFDSYVVDSGGGQPTTTHVEAIVLGTQGVGKGQQRGTATVTLRDDLGDPVSGATVTGTFSGDFNETTAGTTGTDGTVTLATTGTRKGSVSLTFCVDDVSHASLTYDPTANVETCEGPGP